MGLRTWASRAAPRMTRWGAVLAFSVALSLACGRYGRPVRTPPPPPQATPAPAAVHEPDSKPTFDLQTPDFGVGDDKGLEEEEDDEGN